MTRYSGGCSCGKLRFVALGDPDRVGVCHCLECRKHHGAPFFAAAIYPRSAVQVTGVTDHHEDRHYCPTCGASVFAISGDEIELHLGAFDTPNLFAPTYELWTIRREHWLAPIPNVRQYARNRTGDDT